jgi:diacylglycerol kinase
MMKFFAMFGYALSGVTGALIRERNMKIHAVAAVLACFCGWYFKLSAMQFLWVLSAIVLVFITELLNTAVEKTVDLISPDPHPLAKMAKDTAAGAVLVASIYAVIVGLLMFGGPVLRLFFGTSS